MNTLKRKPILLWIVGAALLAAALGCASLPALPSGGPAPTPTLFTLPTLPSSGGAKSGGSALGGGSASGGDHTPLTFSDAVKSNLTSFRTKFTLSYNGANSSGKAVQGNFTMEQAHTTNPAATSIQWNGQGDINAGSNGSFQMVQIGQATYLVTSEGGTPKCVTMSAGGSTPSQTTPSSPDTYLAGSDLSKARRILPDEMVNGVLTRHYQFTKADVLLGYSEWTNYTADIWNAADGNYTVKATFSGDGKEVTFNGGQGHVEWSYNLSDINAPINIQPPSGCEAPAGSDFPKMPDASNVTSIGSMFNYTTASPTADVVAFYNAQLPPLGWVAGTANTTVPGMATLEFTKDSKKATITITESNGKTTVLISIQ